MVTLPGDFQRVVLVTGIMAICWRQVVTSLFQQKVPWLLRMVTSSGDFQNASIVKKFTGDFRW